MYFLSILLNACKSATWSSEKWKENLLQHHFITFAHFIVWTKSINLNQKQCFKERLKLIKLRKAIAYFIGWIILLLYRHCCPDVFKELFIMKILLFWSFWMFRYRKLCFDANIIAYFKELKNIFRNPINRLKDKQHF